MQAFIKMTFINSVSKHFFSSVWLYNTAKGNKDTRATFSPHQQLSDQRNFTMSNTKKVTVVMNNYFTYLCLPIK